MEPSGQGTHVSTLRDYFSVLKRRKLTILQVGVILPIVAVVVSLQQQPEYRATAKVLLSSQNLAAQLTGTQTATDIAPDRVGQTQADVARVPAVAARVLRRVEAPGMTIKRLRDTSTVRSVANSDFLEFTVTNPKPLLARKLVNAFALEYTIYRRELDTASISKALRDVQETIAELVRSRETKTALYASLVLHQQTLESMEVLQTSNASVVERAAGVVQTQPKPVRNGIVALVLGLVFGIALAFLREALDTRIRTSEEVVERLGRVPLLARLSAPSSRLRSDSRLVMLTEPASVRAESFRMLRTNLDFVTLDRSVKALMVTSAVEREGKSTTIANLAVALALSGRRVVLVDLDLRRPYLHRFFDLEGPGVTEVALGQVTLEDALVEIPIGDPDRPAASKARHTGALAAESIGRLEVLPCGLIPPDPGEFSTTRALSDILEALKQRSDIVLVDTPPVLRVGDAMALATKVDGIVTVSRLRVVRRQTLADLVRQLATVPTPVLGVVVTGSASGGSGYGYGYGYGYGQNQETKQGRTPKFRSRAGV